MRIVCNSRNRNCISLLIWIGNFVKRYINWQFTELWNEQHNNTSSFFSPRNQLWHMGLFIIRSIILFDIMKYSVHMDLHCWVYLYELCICLRISLNHCQCNRIQDQGTESYVVLHLQLVQDVLDAVQVDHLTSVTHVLPFPVTSRTNIV